MMSIFLIEFLVKALMELLIAEFEPEQLELLKIIGLGQQEIQEVPELEPNKQFCMSGQPTEKLSETMVQLKEVGNFPLLHDWFDCQKNYLLNLDKI